MMQNYVLSKLIFFLEVEFLDCPRVLVSVDCVAQYYEKQNKNDSMCANFIFDC